MKRAGGWILGLLVVGAMGGGGWFALRGALNRETIGVCYVESPRGRRPTTNAILRGAEFALQEAEGRAGRFRVEISSNNVAAWFGTSEALLSLGHPQGRPLHVSVFDTYPLEPLECTRISPGPSRQGESAARWVKQTGLSKVFLLNEPSSQRSMAISASFERTAKELGMRVAGPTDALVAAVDQVLAAQVDLVFYSGEEAPYSHATKVFTALRQKGFSGSMVTAEADPEVSYLATRLEPRLFDAERLPRIQILVPRQQPHRGGDVPRLHRTGPLFEGLSDASRKLPAFEDQREEVAEVDPAQEPSRHLVLEEMHLQALFWEVAARTPLAQMEPGGDLVLLHRRQVFPRRETEGESLAGASRGGDLAGPQPIGQSLLIQRHADDVPRITRHFGKDGLQPVAHESVGMVAAKVDVGEFGQRRNERPQSLPGGLNFLHPGLVLPFGGAPVSHIDGDADRKRAHRNPMPAGRTHGGRSSPGGRSESMKRSPRPLGRIIRGMITSTNH